MQICKNTKINSKKHIILTSWPFWEPKILKFAAGKFSQQWTCKKKKLSFLSPKIHSSKLTPKTTLPETHQNTPENRPSQEETIVFQPSIFRRELLVSGRVDEDEE